MAKSDETILALAIVQHGVVTRAQARAAGLSEHQVRYRVRNQRWEPLGPGAFVVAAALAETDPVLSPLIAACLTLGGMASHRSAAWLWGIDANPSFRAEVTVSRARHHRRPGVTVYSTTQIELAGLTIIRHIPSTGVERTLIDMATLVQPDRLAELVERAVALGLTDHFRLKRAGQAHSQRGRPGVARFRRVVDDAA